jgi:prophage endopeptidase
MSGWKGYVLVAVASAWMVWLVQGWRYSAQISSLNAQHDRALADAANAAKAQQDKLTAERDDLAQRWAKSESDLYGKLRDAETKNDQLRADVDAGTQRLRVRATCPKPADHVPQTGTGAGLDDGTAAELDPAARPDYFALRQGIERVTKQLQAWQAREQAQEEANAKTP